ncbi:acyl-coenzyme A thioesterase 8 isoform X2 [Nothobranchius furzeri]|uniref:acyl-coenzyme A thioesterase 8 isoform X2 n=1 Tax=Nothobranchius furzeri TaxID=105023 RepID=UPI002404697A|nr:acyl-coenzyme A thioesterase 8 isoform X2 [Nothobranchius furzeri]
MAGRKTEEEVHSVSRSSDPPGPGEDSSSQSSDAPYPQDLRSVLVTSVLNLEELDVDLYRGTHHWVPHTQRLFGGQIMGQALVAAAKSVSDNLYAHSLHCYFVRAGDPKVPVLYQVDRTRDGRSFTVRSVKAIQHGQPILICQASFQVLQTSPLQHQFTMPVVPQPEDLLTAEELIQRYLSKPDLTENAREGLNKLLANEVPIEIKPVRPAHFHRLAPAEPKRLFWARARGYIGSSRGLAQGRLWRRDGVLAATCSQEGVLRVKPVTHTSKL